MSTDTIEPDTTAGAAALTAIYNRTIITVSRRQAAGVGEPRESAILQLRALAMMTRINYPAAAFITLEASDQPGSDDMYVDNVFDAQGNRLSVAGVDAFDDQWYDDMLDLGCDLWTWIGSDLPGVTEVRQNGTARLDVQVLLDESDSLTPPANTPEASAARGADLLAKYKALTEYSADDQDAALDLLLDLQHWALQNGVDLDTTWAAAKQMLATDG
jgi:hypothetical protein